MSTKRQNATLMSLTGTNDVNDNFYLNFSVPHESFDEDEIRNMRTEALTGSITTYTSGESWSNKGA